MKPEYLIGALAKLPPPPPTITSPLTPQGTLREWLAVRQALNTLGKRS